MTMDRLSNNEPVFIDDSWIEQAGEEFKTALRKQLIPNDREFGLRMSNLGRPLCQLQNEQLGTPKSRNPYNHILRMMYGDATEILVTVLLKAAQVNITDAKTKHEFDIDGRMIPGEDDIWIEDKVYDIKSASPYAYSHKWSEGWNGVYYGDSFGYVAQLYGYAGGDPSKMGGWIVVDKSSGELKVVTAKPTVEQLNEIKGKAVTTIYAIDNNLPFKRCFEPEQETHYKKLTGNLVVPTVCTFCDFMRACWPEAKLEPKAMSKAGNPKQVWYISKNDATRSR
jgi:hypothetical protein